MTFEEWPNGRYPSLCSGKFDVHVSENWTMNPIYSDQKFEAIVYSTNRSLIAQCYRAMSENRFNWIMLDSAKLASDYLSHEHFDFILVDLDSPEGASILSGLSSGKFSQGVVFAISGEATDPGILKLCYQSQFFYPVRLDDIESHLYRAVPLAERRSAHKQVQVSAELSINSQETNLYPTLNIEHNPEALRSNSLALYARRIGKLGRALVSGFADVLRMKHSLSVIAQERAASFMAALGTIWFVADITSNFHSIVSIGPPSSGPTELIGLSVLLWLCAKSRRSSSSSMVPAQVEASEKAQ